MRKYPAPILFGIGTFFVAMSIISVIISILGHISTANQNAYAKTLHKERIEALQTILHSASGDKAAIAAGVLPDSTYSSTVSSLESETNGNVSLIYNGFSDGDCLVVFLLVLTCLIWCVWFITVQRQVNQPL